MNDEQQKMSCPACGAVWFSASAVDLVSKGARCMRCDGPLELPGDTTERSQSRQPDGETANGS